MVEEVSVALEEMDAARRQLDEDQRALSDSRRLAARGRRWEELFDLAPDPCFLTDLDGGILGANRSAAELLGRRPEALVGKPLSALIAMSDRRRFRDEVVQVARTRRTGPVVLDLLTADRGPAPASVSAMVLGHEGDHEPVIRWVVHGLPDPDGPEDGDRSSHQELEARVLERTAQLEAANAWKDELLRRADGAKAEAESIRAELEFLVRASEVLASSLDHETTLANVAALAVPAMADWCVVDLLEPDGSLRQTAVSHADPQKIALVRELRDRYPPDAAHSIWRVIASGKPEVAPTVLDSDLVRRARDGAHLSLLRAVGIRSHVVAPLSARGQVLGAISLVYGPSGRRYRERSVDLAVELARRCAVALDNARLHTQAADAVKAHQEAQHRLDFLLRASTVLNDSLDYRATLRGLGRLAVERIGDLCLIDVLQEDGGIRRMVAVHADPARQELASRLEGPFSPQATGAHPAVEVIRTGRAVLSQDMSGVLRSITPDEERDRITMELGMTSFMCIPLVHRGRALGAITLVSTTEGRRFSPSDLALAKDLADRAALAVDNARLYGDRDAVARTLQQSLLPPTVPEIPGVEVAVRYLAAGEGNEVGGDFYDVFPVRDGSWGVVIGDVRGKGAGAAAVMGLVRHTVRAAAMQVRRPSRILSIVNEAMRQQTTEERFATVGYVRLSPAPGCVRLTVSSGGHLLPVVLTPGGAVEPVGEPGMLLGLFADPQLTDRTRTIEPGEALILYTDGVIEARSGKGFFGEGRLGATLAAVAGSPAESIADRVIRDVVEFGEGHPRDDLALVVLRIPPA
jgi:GAF domain-containing protein